MLSSLKNFAIAFGIAALVFTLLGVFIIVPQIKALTEIATGPADDTNSSQDLVDPVPGIISTTVETPPGFENDRSFTMLLVGSDYQPDVFNDYRYAVRNSTDAQTLYTHQRRFKAEVIMLIRYSAETGTFMMSAIPSNLQITSSGCEIQLCELLEKKGIESFCTYVSSLTGISIDYYINCQISLTASIFDKVLGNFLFYVPTDMYYVDEEERIVVDGASRDPIYVKDDKGEIVYNKDGTPKTIPVGRAFKIDLEKGAQKLTGEKVTWVLRYNSYKNGYTERREVQQSFFEAFFDTYFKEEYREKLQSVVKLINSSKAGETNLTELDFEQIADTLLAYSRYEKVTVKFPGINTGSGQKEVMTYDLDDVKAEYIRYKQQ